MPALRFLQMKTALDPRHQKREKIVQELFANSFLKQKTEDDTVSGIIKEKELIDKIIVDAAPEFPLDRINPVDLAVLRLATYELTIIHSEPPKVIIDEAIELAKQFGGETSPGFVNGALGKILFSRLRVLRLIADQLGIETDKIRPEMALREDLGASDLEIADLTQSLEKNLRLIIPPGTKFITVSDIFEFVEDHEAS